MSHKERQPVFPKAKVPPVNPAMTEETGSAIKLMEEGCTGRRTRTADAPNNEGTTHHAPSSEEHRKTAAQDNKPQSKHSTQTASVNDPTMASDKRVDSANEATELPGESICIYPAQEGVVEVTRPATCGEKTGVFFVLYLIFAVCGIIDYAAVSLLHKDLGVCILAILIFICGFIDISRFSGTVTVPPGIRREVEQVWSCCFIVCTGLLVLIVLCAVVGIVGYGFIALFRFIWCVCISLLFLCPFCCPVTCTQQVPATEVTGGSANYGTISHASVVAPETTATNSDISSMPCEVPRAAAVSKEFPISGGVGLRFRALPAATAPIEDAATVAAGDGGLPFEGQVTADTTPESYAPPPEIPTNGSPKTSGLDRLGVSVYIISEVCFLRKYSLRGNQEIPRFMKLRTLKVRRV